MGRPKKRALTGAARTNGGSIDQFVATKINEDQPLTIVPSVELVLHGNNTNGSQVNANMTASFSKGGGEVPYKRNSMDVYSRLFPGDQFDQSGQNDAQAAEIARNRLRRKKSVLDFVANEFSSVKKGLSKNARERLDLTGSAIRSMEQSLAIPEIGDAGNTEAACLTVDTGGLRDDRYKARTIEDYKARAYPQLEMIQSAFACDTTRVVSLAVAMPPVPADGFQDQHIMCHETSDKSGSNGAVGRVRQSQIAYMETFAKLGELLDEIKEEDGRTALDNTALLWCGEIANGNHSLRGHCWSLLGGLGGAYQTGRYLNLNGATNGELYTSLAKGMGINVNGFGDANGPMSEL